MQGLTPLLLLIFAAFAGRNATAGYSAAYGSFYSDQTCYSASPNTLGWAYKLFGNATTPAQVLPTISEWQLEPDPRLLAAGGDGSPSCIFGICDDQTYSCKCSRNWVGSRCQYCTGRTLWSNERGLVASNAMPSYQDNSRCTWIITPPSSFKINPHLQLKIANFSTECAWDLLFIFDGTAALSTNLLAVISGDMASDQLGSFPAIYSKSGSVLIYFYSDAYLNYGGFSLEYTFSYCPRNCSGHGQCSFQSYSMTYSGGLTTTSSLTTQPSITSTTCTCDPGYRGESCEFIQCLNDCSSTNGTCQPDGSCRCKRGFLGLDCSIDASKSSSSGYWNVLPIQSADSSTTNNRSPAAGGALVVVDSTVWLFGGFDFATRFNTLSLRTFDLTLQYFNNNISTGNSIYNRYGLSASIRDHNTVILFGGTLTWSNRITSELVLFDLTTLNSTRLSGFTTQSNPPNKPLPAALTGHSAHLITTDDSEQLFVFFGYSPDYGLSDWLRIYDFNSSTWRPIQSPFAGRAWHTSVYDEDSNAVFIYGGFAAAHRKSSVDVSSDLIRFDVATLSWSYIGQLSQRRAFHSAILLPNSKQMLIHGGTMHETTTSASKTLPEAGLCVVTRPFVLDLATGCSSVLNDALSTQFLPSISRIGHVPLVWNDSALYFGGFDGTVIDNQLLQFIPLPCQSRTNVEECLVLNGFTCKWACQQCYTVSTIVSGCSIVQLNTCDDKINMTVTANSTLRDCKEKTSCASCILFQPDEGRSCQWMSGEYCISYVASQQVPTTTQDPISDLSGSSSLIQTQSLVTNVEQCPISCYALNDCYSCTKQSTCLWCNTLALCVPSDAYRIAFPYGQCQDWTMTSDTCRTNCSSYHSCDDCQQDLRCGWCDDGSGTGTGSCMVGGLNAALNVSSLNAPGCPAGRWYFSKCPLCQCSGHSVCINGTDQCLECKDNTEGKTCDRCINGYYGSALNGGVCQLCQCNGHATYCDNLSGVCKCDTQGVSGSHCEVCDRTYEGDAITDTCYYPIQTGYRYTMDLTKKDMVFINKINFQTKDRLGRNDVNFKLNCSRPAGYVLSYVTGAAVNSTEVELQSGICAPDLPQVEISVSPTGGVPFSEPNFRFRISISNFTHPFLITLVATEEQPFLIYLLLIAVFGCFLVVLVIAIVVFQIKRRYDDYHRRQQVKIELRRMAKRPFAIVNFLIVPSSPISSRQNQHVWETNSSDSISSRSNLLKSFQPRAPPMPVSLQPLAQPGAAIMTVIIQLPLVSAIPNPDSETDATLGAPSALAAGSVVVRAASNLLSDLGSRSRQPSLPSTALAASETTLCAGSSSNANSNTASRSNNTTSSGIDVNDSTVSPVMTSSGRRSTCWNTPPGSINTRPSGLRTMSAASHPHQVSASPDITTPNSPGAPTQQQVESSLSPRVTTSNSGRVRHET